MDEHYAGASSLGAIRYDKLVRDRIPEIVSAGGLVPVTRTLGEHEYVAALRAKVVEEAAELADASDEELVEELADLQEVCDALSVALRISAEDVRRVREERARLRGRFEKRTLLIETHPREKR